MRPVPDCAPGCRCHRWRKATPLELRFLEPGIQMRVRELRSRGGLRKAKENRELARLLAHDILIPEPTSWRGRLRQWWAVKQEGWNLGKATRGATTDDRAQSERAG